MIASLGMYDRPETATANDRFWALVRDGLRSRGIDAPDGLDRETPFMQAWTDPELVFSQTCGMPYRVHLHGMVGLVATPDYGLPNCPPGYYCSLLVAHSDDPRAVEAMTGCTFAFNEAGSQSGWAAPMTWLAANGIAPGDFVKSGGHRLSAQAVAQGKADLAAIDALTWRMLQRWDNFATKLRVVAQTTPTPTLPYVCGSHVDVATVRAALADAVANLDATSRDLLSLNGVLEIDAATYLAVPTPPPPSICRELQ